MPGASGNPDEVPRPDPAGRPWFHPSELPAETPARAGAVARRHRLAVPVTAGVAGAVAAFGLGALAFGPSSGPSGGPDANRVVATPTVLGGSPGAGAEGSVARGVLRVTAWQGARPRYGSAIAYGVDGLALTSAGLVEDAGAVELSWEEGRGHAADVVGIDHVNDLAVLRAAGAKFDPVSFESSDGELRVGTRCFLVDGGHRPGGARAVAEASVGAVGGMLRNDHGWTIDVMTIEVGHTTNGSRGSAVIDADGSLLGIVIGSRRGDGVAALPTGTASRSAAQIVAHGRALHAWMGVATVDAPPRGSGTAAPRGALVEAIAPESPAARAGLRVGDVVLSVDGSDIAGMASLVRAVRSHEPGDAVVVDVERDGAARSVRVVLGGR